MGDIRLGLGFPAGKLFAEGLVLPDDAPLPSPPDGGRLIVHVAPVVKQAACWWEAIPEIEEPPEQPSTAKHGRALVVSSGRTMSTPAVTTRRMQMAVMACMIMVMFMASSCWPSARGGDQTSRMPLTQPRPPPASPRSHVTLSRLALLAQGLDPVELPASITQAPNRTAAITRSQKPATAGMTPWRSSSSGPSLLRVGATSSPSQAPPLRELPLTQGDVAAMRVPPETMLVSPSLDVLPLIWMMLGKPTRSDGSPRTESAPEAPLAEVRYQWKHILAIAAPATAAVVTLWRPITKHLRDLITLIARRLLPRQHCERIVRVLHPLGFVSAVACSAIADPP